MGGLSRYIREKLAEDGYTPKTVLEDKIKNSKEFIKRSSALCKVMLLKPLKEWEEE